MSIEKKVDKLISNRYTPKRISRTKKYRKLMGVLAVFIACAVVTTASVFVYFVEMDVTGTVGVLLEFDDQTAEDLDVTESFSGYGNDVFTFDHWLNLSNCNNNLNVTITWSNTDPAITCEFLYGGENISYLDMSPNTDYAVQTRYTIAEKATNGVYSPTFTIT